MREMKERDILNNKENACYFYAIIIDLMNKVNQIRVSRQAVFA